MAGASVAYRLSLAGASVLVMEQEAQPGYHSTGRSAALFIESYGSQQIRALTQASHDFYRAPPAGFAAHPILTPRGALYVAQPGQEALLAAERAAYRAQGLAIEDLTPDEAITRVPCLLREQLAAAMLDVAASDIDVHELHQGFLRGMRAHGAELECDFALARASWGAHRWTVHAHDGRSLQAKILVNAAGAWVDTVAAACAVAPLGIQPMRRSAFLFDPPAGVDVSAWPSVM